MSRSVSIVVPVYNEAEFIPRALPTLVKQVMAAAPDAEILIVENGSADGTAETARRISTDPPVRVISLPDPDYGAAMKHGFLVSEGAWVVNFDIDYFSGEFLRTVLSQPDDVDLVIASKRDPRSKDRRSLIRRLATRVFNLLLRMILGSRVSDTHGMKGFRRGLVDDVAPKVLSTKDLFDTELVIRAERAGYRIVEVPVEVKEMRTARSSLVKRVPRTIKGLFRIRKALSES
ncbi:MAG TPA: glycosyltransferase family 2 protein [Acidimicrobiia bacterium]